MADLKGALLAEAGSPGARKLPLLSSVTDGNLAGAGSARMTPPGEKPKSPYKRAWTLVSPKEKQFEDVEVTAKDFTMEAMGRIFTSRALADENKKVGKLMTRMTMMLDKMVPEEEDVSEVEEVKGLQTNGEATLNLLNQCLGSGMLGMGFAIAQTGLLAGLITMVFSLFLNKHTLMLNVKVCEFAGVPPASTEVGKVAFGAKGQLILVIMVSLLGFFCMVSYIDASADAVKGILSLKLDEDQLPSEHAIAVVVWALTLVPPTFIRSMNMVAMLSFIAFCGSIGIVVSVTGVCVTILAHQGLPPLASIKLFPKDFASFLNALPILVLVFAFQAGGDVVLATMKDNAPANKEKVAFFAQRVVLCMLYFMGALCYITFGEDVKGDVLQSIPSTSMAGVICRICSLDLVILSYMIMMIPCKVSIIDLVFGKNEAKQESTLAEYYGTVMVINVAALVVAMGISDLSLVLGLDGAVCTNFVAFLLPAAFWIKIQSAPADPDSYEAVPKLSAANVPYYFIFGYGVFSLTMSSYQVLQRFMQA